MPESGVFKICRTLGFVSNDVPFIVRYIKRRRDNYITTCIGRSFQTYNASQLALVQISDLHPKRIACMTNNFTNTYTACGNVIFAWKNGVELLRTYEPNSSSDVVFMLTVGLSLVSVDDKNVLRHWIIDSGECSSEVPFEAQQFQISAIMHPETYPDQVLLASTQGSLKLWDYCASRIICDFTGWQSPVCAMEQAPADNVVAVGLADGRVVIHNLMRNETIMTLHQDYGHITNISFRTDGLPMMASASPNGHVVIWDLEKRAVAYQLLNAHDCSVTGLRFLPSEPVMVTSSPDNTLKMWIFDMADGGPRLLRLREGHSSPPTMIRFYDIHNIVSSGNDSTMRIFNLQTERFNKSFGKALFLKKHQKKKLKRELRDKYKMPPITQFQMEKSQENDFNNIVAIHANMKTVTTWSSKKQTRGEINFNHDYFQEMKENLGIKTAATCLHLTHCGNFVLIGYSTGFCLKFNVQSGLLRGGYGKPRAHNQAINGVAADIINEYAITGSGKIVRFWPFDSHNVNQYLNDIIFESSVSFFRVEKNFSMLAVVLEDFTIAIVDINKKSVVRNLNGHASRVNDLLFGPDLRWIITAGMDAVIKVWDLSTAQLVDHFRMESPCVSLALSEQGEYLATAHVNFLGLYLWSNKTLFRHVSLRAIDECREEAPFVDLSNAALRNDTEDVEDENDKEATETNEADMLSVFDLTAEQVNADCITLADLPMSYWKEILNIDTVRERNKPTKPIKKPEKAPFFLPTVSTLKDFEFDLSQVNLQPEQQEELTLPVDFENYTEFAKHFIHCFNQKNYQEIIEKLKSLKPVQLNFEIGCLLPNENGSVAILRDFLRFLNIVFESKREFDLAHACLSLFLKNHENHIIANEELSSSLRTITKTSKCDFEDDLLYCIGTLKTLKYT